MTDETQETPVEEEQDIAVEETEEETQAAPVPRYSLVKASKRTKADMVENGLGKYVLYSDYLKLNKTSTEEFYAFVEQRIIDENDKLKDEHKQFGTEILKLTEFLISIGAHPEVNEQYPKGMSAIDVAIETIKQLKEQVTQ